jgi:hypothetical protein
MPNTKDEPEPVPRHVFAGEPLVEQVSPAWGQPPENRRRPESPNDSEVSGAPKWSLELVEIALPAKEKARAAVKTHAARATKRSIFKW